MRGQGRPTPTELRLGGARRFALCGRVRIVVPTLRAAVILLLTLASAAGVGADEADSTMRLRIAFGGGRPRVWHGDITLSEGEFADPVLLGLPADEPGSMQFTAGRVSIRQPSPRSYDGLDISVHAPLNAQLTLRLIDPRDVEVQKTIQISLQDLVVGAQPTPDAAELDDAGNRLVVRRVPGDTLRVQTLADSFVYSPGETFRFRVLPHRLPAPAGASLELELKISSRLTGKEVFSTEKNVVLDAAGSAAALGPFDFAVPAGDDVFQLEITARNQGVLDVQRAIVDQRRVQFVAIDARQQLGAGRRSEVRQVDELDPVLPQWQNRVAQLPLVRHLPRLQQGPLTHGEARTVKRGDRNWMQLSADGWQAFPLSVGDPTRPHVVQIEYPIDQPQTLGISIVEPNSVGEVAPIGVDSAVEVLTADTRPTPAFESHRLIFWPKTTTPLLLVKSQDSARGAAFGKITVEEYAGDLPAKVDLPPRPARRLVAAWYDKPLMVENFGAPDARDESTGRSFDDWRTFYLGGQRMVQTLRHSGYNAAMVAVWSDGSTIYPSRLLQPGPKYDTGMFLTGGEDPRRKDGLEMLLRLFDREGLTLVPTLQFNAPLPELESIAVSGVRERIGLKLVDRRGNVWRDASLDRDGVGVHYNPLDERVQTAMLRVVAELVERYGHHPSFGGVNIQLTPHGYAMLPGANWGFDDRTFAQFAAAAHISDPAIQAGGRSRFAARAGYCVGPGREAWLTWRSQRMLRLYQGMATQVARAGESARLYLGGGEMLNDESIRRLLRPQVIPGGHAAEELSLAFLELGIDAESLSREPGLVVMLPHAPLPTPSVGEPPTWQIQPLTALFGRSPNVGLLQFRPPTTGGVPSFDERSPFGSEKTNTWLVAQVSATGPGNRRDLVKALAQRDITAWAGGGWMLPLGQQHHTRELLATLSQLPPTQLRTITTGAPAQQPLVVRAGEVNGQTYVTIINPSKWKVGAQLATNASWRTPVLGLGGRELPALVQTTGGSALAVELEPYDCVAAVIDGAGLSLSLDRVELPPDAKDEISRQVEDLRVRATALARPRVAAGPPNAKFESPLGDDGSVSGWANRSRGPELSVDLADFSHEEGRQSLRLFSGGPVAWVRSDPITVPATGRITVWMWLRRRAGQPQPPLRLAIEGRLDGQSYYRFARVGSDAAPVNEEWAPYVLQINDLPRQGLTDLRVGFDLMGPGEVFIDNVEVFDLNFNEAELTEINKLLATANFLQRDGYHASAAEVLDSDWLRFLGQHVERPQRQKAATDREDNLLREARRRARERLQNVPRPQSMFDRLRGWVPSSPF